MGPGADPAAVGAGGARLAPLTASEVLALPKRRLPRSLALLVYVCFIWLFASADNLDPLAL